MVLTPPLIENETVETNPILAFSWNRHLYIFQVVKSAGQTPSMTTTHLSPERKAIPDNGKTPKLDFVKVGDWICREGIVGIQWVRSQVKMCYSVTSTTHVSSNVFVCILGY